MPIRRSLVRVVDLVFLAALSGLGTALFALEPSAEIRQIDLILIGGAAVLWHLLHGSLCDRTCERCERVFRPSRRAEPVFHCPDCDARQTRFIQSRRPWALACLATLPPIAAFALAAWAFWTGVPGADESIQTVLFRALVVSAMGEALSILALSYLVRIRDRLVTTRNQTCQACGARLQVSPSASVCRRCLRVEQSPRLLLREVSTNIRLYSVALAIVVLALLAIVVLSGLAFIRREVWYGTAGCVVGSLGCWFFVMRLTAFADGCRGLLVLANEQEALALARELAGEPGTITRDGANVVWYSGPNDPTPRLRQELEAAIVRVESLFGRTIGAIPPFRVFAFHDQDAFIKLFTRIAPVVPPPPIPVIVLGSPWSMVGFCTELFRDDPCQVGPLISWCLARSLGDLSRVPWIAAGLPRFLESPRESLDLAGLNRRMAEAISNTTAWSEDLFAPSVMDSFDRDERPSSRELTEAQKRIEVFSDQASSIIEYLLGEQAPAARRAAFQAFLLDSSPDAHTERALVRHVGLDYSALLKEWRVWVMAQAPR